MVTSEKKAYRKYDCGCAYHEPGFPGGPEGKESASNVGVTGLIPESGRFPGKGNGNLLQYSCLENPHGQGNLAGYSPWGHKESETTEQLYFHFPFSLYHEPNPVLDTSVLFVLFYLF